jgi:hypothetical protein
VKSSNLAVGQVSVQNPNGSAPRASAWVSVKSKAFRSFLNNACSALGQAMFEFLKNHELPVDIYFGIFKRV